MINIYVFPALMRVAGHFVFCLFADAVLRIIRHQYIIYSFFSIFCISFTAVPIDVFWGNTHPLNSDVNVCSEYECVSSGECALLFLSSFFSVFVFTDCRAH